MIMTTDVQIGTRVLANDNFSQRLGEVCRIDYTPWGKHYVIAVDGGGIDTADRFFVADRVSQIGWYVATPEMVKLYR